MELQDFITVVEPMEPLAADEQFESWLSERPALRARLLDDDIRIDLIRGKGGVCLRRYRVRRSVLE